MTEYLLQIEDATKKLMKCYEVTEECPVRASILEGRTQIIITDKVKFDGARAAQKKHEINTHAMNAVDFTEQEPKLSSTAFVINTITGESSIAKQAVTAGYIYKWTESGWDEIIPEVGEKRFIHFLNAIYAYDGSKWSATELPLPKLEYRKDGDSIAWDIVE